MAWPTAARGVWTWLAMKPEVRKQFHKPESRDSDFEVRIAGEHGGATRRALCTDHSPVGALTLG